MISSHLIGIVLCPFVQKQLPTPKTSHMRHTMSIHTSVHFSKVVVWFSSLSNWTLRNTAVLVNNCQDARNILLTIMPTLCRGLPRSNSHILSIDWHRYEMKKCKKSLHSWKNSFVDHHLQKTCLWMIMGSCFPRQRESEPKASNQHGILSHETHVNTV